MEKSSLEARINNLITTRAGEKQTLNSLEKKYMEEKKQRGEYQVKLESERKSKKEAAAERKAALTEQSANSATVSKLEAELAKVREELGRAESGVTQIFESISRPNVSANFIFFGTYGKISTVSDEKLCLICK